MYESKKFLIHTILCLSVFQIVAMFENAYEDFPQEAVVEALSTEAAFTQSGDPKYVVATYGCFYGAIEGGYDKTNQSAFVANFATKRGVELSGGIIFHHISRSVLQPLKSPIQLYLRGGGGNDCSMEVLAPIKAWMKNYNDFQMEIASETINLIGDKYVR